MVFDHVRRAIITLVLIIIMVRTGITITIIRRVGCIVVGVKVFINLIGGFITVGEFNLAKFIRFRVAIDGLV